MNNLIEAFIRQIAAEEKRQRTLAQYSNNLNLFERWLKENHHIFLDEEHIQSVTSVILMEYYQSLHSRGLKISTRNAYVIAVKLFFEFLTSARIISEDPSAVLHIIRDKKRRSESEKKMCSNSEIESLLNMLANDSSQHNALRDTAIIALILGSGLRAFEVGSLNVSHLEDIRDGIICIERKGGDWEHIHVASFVCGHIERYLSTRHNPRQDDPLFISQKGNRMNPNSIWKTLAHKQRQLEIHTGVHRFRHTFLTDVERGQKNGAALARDLAGHKSIQITDAYLHSTPEERREAVNHMSYAEQLSL